MTTLRKVFSVESDPRMRISREKTVDVGMIIQIRRAPRKTFHKKNGLLITTEVVLCSMTQLEIVLRRKHLTEIILRRKFVM